MSYIDVSMSDWNMSDDFLDRDWRKNRLFKSAARNLLYNILRRPLYIPRYHIAYRSQNTAVSVGDRQRRSRRGGDRNNKTFVPTDRARRFTRKTSATAGAWRVTTPYAGKFTHVRNPPTAGQCGLFDIRDTVNVRSIRSRGLCDLV